MSPAPPEDTSITEAVEEHYRAFLGAPTVVWRQPAPQPPPIDLLAWFPTDERPWFTFATLGMSALPMRLPPGATESGMLSRIELLLCLPPTWPVPTPGGAGPEWPGDSFMPIGWLTALARMPHDRGSFLGFGHTIPNGNPPRPLTDGTGLCAWVLLPPITLPDGFRRVDAGGELVECFALIALHRDEVDVKNADGVRALFDGFDAHFVSEVFDPARPSTVE